MPNPVAHFEILGHDPDRLRSFYGALFGWRIDPPLPGDPRDYSMVYPGDGAIDGGIGKPRRGDGGVGFHIAVDDLQATLDRAVELGGRAVVPPTKVGPQTAIAAFADPEGHVIGLVKE